MLYQINNYSIVLFGIYDQEIIAWNPNFYKCYLFAFILEIIAMMLAFIFGIVTINIISKSAAFHKNFQNIITIFIGEFLVAEVFRIVLIAYQFGFIKITGTLYIDLPLLISSFYRMYIYCAALCTLNTGLMERLFAVFFVRDYEYIERLWIQWYLQIWGTSVCIACSVGYTFFGTLESGLFFKIMLIVLLSLIVIACLIFIFISYLNANFLKLLLTTFDIKKYTLSRRFQLEENVKALLLIKQMFLSHGVYCFFAMGLFATPYVIFELNTPELELSIALFETTMSLYPVYFMPYILYLTPSWREKTAIYLKSILKMKPHIRRRVQRTKSTSNEQETKIYFDQLRDLWA